MKTTITRWKNLLDTNGETTETTWAEVFAWLSRRQLFRGTEKHPGWSPAEFVPAKRDQDNVSRVFALCLDYDDKGETIDGVRERLSAFYGLLHTTRKHAPDAPRFRVVLPLARPVSPFEFAALWTRFASVAGSIDQAPKDPSRFWFAPGCPDDSEFVAEELTGALLDPDEWLKKPEPSATRRDDDYRPAAPQTDAEARAVAYIAKMPAAIAGQGGHQATWDVAVMLAKGFGLSESATLRVLTDHYNPRCEPAWKEKELAHKAKGAARSRLPEGFKLESDREWAPQRASVPREPEPERQREPDDWETQALEPEEIEEQTPPKSAVERWGVVSLREMFLEVYEMAKSGKSTVGLTTGNRDIDEVLGGLRAGNVTVLGAGTSWGKSTFSIMTADENDKAGKTILVVAGEDERLMYGRRFMARRGRMNAMRLRDNDLSKEELSKIIAIAGKASRRPIFLRAIGMPVERICKAIREINQEVDIDLVVADYVQRFKTERRLQDRKNQVSYVAESLSDEIKNAGAAGMILSQLKRIEGRLPTLEDLKESGDLENAAEHVLLGHKEKMGQEHGIERFRRSVIVGKNKDGPIPGAEIPIPFDEASASFGVRSGPTDDLIDDLAQPYAMPDFATPPQPYNERAER